MTNTIARHKQSVPRRGNSRRLLAIILVFAGIGILLYPVAATQINNQRQRDFADKYNQQVQQVDVDVLAGDREAAKEYNATLSGVPILDPWLLKADATPGSDAYREYESQLDRFDAIARIRVPSAQIDLPVFHGTSDEVLAKGAGHLYGTSLPVGGTGTHTVLTSHTGLSNATLFDHLIDVVEGDLMLVEVAGETMAYRVDQIKVVLPSEIGDLTAVEGEDYLTLFTCTPYAVNSHRLLVRGERVDYEPAEMAPSAAGWQFTMESWMWYLVAGAGAGVLAIVVIVVRSRRVPGPDPLRKAPRS